MFVLCLRTRQKLTEPYRPESQLLMLPKCCPSIFSGACTSLLAVSGSASHEGWCLLQSSVLQTGEKDISAGPVQACTYCSQRLRAPRDLLSCCENP
eukprot:5273859-Amphidinium_carterae.1